MLDKSVVAVLVLGKPVWLHVWAGLPGTQEFPRMEDLGC